MLSFMSFNSKLIGISRLTHIFYILFMSHLKFRCEIPNTLIRDDGFFITSQIEAHFKTDNKPYLGHLQTMPTN